MTGFLKRHAYRNIEIKDEITSANESASKELPQKLAKIIEVGGYIPDQVRNVDESVDKAVSKKEIIDVALETPDSKEHGDKDEEGPALNADLIKEGLNLVSKLSNHFVKHDPKEEQTGKSQLHSKSLMSNN
ncbi:hypothetical protein CDAR_413391 [Caerostris darwini]|uniref:Uncharacterized protein n=1 Tax=Caerostris darwini TaxID=1538125 RepID=A0AAV4T1J6_9ARAC|nr:hypothetical protein CDAR_413391 [Caerostris darwini]